MYRLNIGRLSYYYQIPVVLKSEASYGRFFVACESSGHSYATGGYFVGVLPVRFRCNDHGYFK